MTMPTDSDRWITLLETLGVCARLLREAWGELLVRHELRPAEFSVLWICRQARGDGVGQTQLADRLAVSPAHVSSCVEQLRRHLLIESVRDPLDRRRQLWRLTPSGEDRLEAVCCEAGQWLPEPEPALLFDVEQWLAQLRHLIESRLKAATVTSLDRCHRKGAA
jgi:DNA-binding MarR family transcriptional regulator